MLLGDDDLELSQFHELFSDCNLNYHVLVPKFPNTDFKRQESVPSQQNAKKNVQCSPLDVEKMNQLHLDRELYEKVNDILEKFSPQNFTVSVSEIKQLDITTPEKLNEVINLVFEKAVSEPDFSIPYANMSSVLTLLKVPSSDQEGCFVDIGKLLFTKCLEEFQRNPGNELNREESICYNEELETDEKRKHDMFEERKNRRRNLGNARFIGWLFKLGTFTEFMIHQCIDKLLHQGDEYALECLCFLIMSVGKKLENDEKALMDSYFTDLEKIINKQGISAKVKLLLKDIIDLRLNNWMSYENLSGLRMINQVLKDCEKEVHEPKRVQLHNALTEPETNAVDQQENRIASIAGYLQKSDYESFEPAFTRTHIHGHPETLHKLNEVNNRIASSAPFPQSRGYDPFEPAFARSDFLGRPMHPGIFRSMGNRSKPPRKITLNIPTNQQVKLHKAENPWVPSHKAVLEPNDTQTQIVYKKVRSILNKLTPQKFRTLLTQFKQLDITTEESLNGVIDLVFKTAIDQPKFAVPYANLCKQLALLKVPSIGQEGQFVNFRKLLLFKCQRKFENNLTDEENREKRMRQIEESETDEKKKQLREDFEEEERKIKRQQLGNIRFIGESFKLGMITGSIMHQCIKKLLLQGDEDSLECLCCLLTIIGKELENDEKPKSTFHGIGGISTPSMNNPSMNNYFDHMKDVVDKRQTSSRVRFMLLDVIDLRINNWVPRRDENNPKTIDQIHKEAEREAHEQQQMLQQMNFTKRMPDDRDRQKSRPPMNEDGWNMSGKSSKGNYSVDPTKLNLTKNDWVPRRDENNPKTIDQIRREAEREEQQQKSTPDQRKLVFSDRPPMSEDGWNIFGKSSKRNYSVDRTKLNLNLIKPTLWSKGSIGEAKSNIDQSSRATPLQHRSAASIRESSIERNNQLPSPAAQKTPAVSREHDSAIEAVKSFTSTGASEQRPPSEARKPQEAQNDNGKVVTASALKGADNLTEEENEKKMKPLIDEFLHNCDFENIIELTVQQSVEPKLRKQITPEEMKQNVERLLQDHESNEAIFNWLEKNVEGEMSPPMYRALVTVIYESNITGSGAKCKLNIPKLKDRMCILARYMDVNRNLELHAIFALQHLINKLDHPKGILLQIFDLAYNEDFLSDDAFKQWENSNDPAEQEGKDAAVHSVNSFFTWLKEGDDDESAESD